MTDSKFTEEQKRLESSISAVIGDLSGSNEPICYDTEPSRKYSIGILHPEQDDENKTQASSKRNPNSLGIEIYLESGSNKLIVDIGFSLYWRALPIFQEQMAKVEQEKIKESDKGKIRFRQKYKREDINTGPIELEINDTGNGIKVTGVEDINSRIKSLLEQKTKMIVDSGESWPEGMKESPFDISVLANEENYKKYIKGSLAEKKREEPNWDAEFSVRVWSINENRVRLGLLLTNTATENPDLKSPQHLYSSKFNVRSANKLLNSEFAAAAQDYRYDSLSWGRGINCVLKIDDDGYLATAETNPVYYQTRTKTRDEMNRACNFKRLSGNEAMTALVEITDWLHSYAEEWRLDNSNYTDERSYSSRLSDLAKFENEIETFIKGVDCLRDDERLLKAFRLANLSFSKGAFPGWRLFQIVFIVSQLPSLLARETSSEELIQQLSTVDVLWFPTGGGKTEAYFGIIATSLFYDRIRGKERGVTAWLRYPLRMLSIQQLQRLMEVVVYCNIVKSSSGQVELSNAEDFSLGYYVGEKNTPNTLTFPTDNPPSKKIEDWKIRVEQSNQNENPLLVLQRCPYPDCRSDNLGTQIDTEKVRIRHVCNVCNNPIPIYISDTEIYRYTPSIIVGTVDRLARAGQRNQFAHLFGRTRYACPDHGFVSFGVCLESGVCNRKKSEYIDRGKIYDPVPSFLLQDELHLLRESLGTYDAHYESFLDTLSSKIGKGLPPKRIAATATIEGYKAHIKELYGREARRFPVKGISEHETAYVALSEESPVSRIFVGIMPTGADMKSVVNQIMTTLGETSEDKEGESQYLDNFYDLMLAYVNQKNVASDLRSFWDDASKIQILTGDKGLSEVRSTIGRIESDDKKDFHERLKYLIATSIISHGVDLERLNLMCFAGTPSNASDYIQASSRVGRKHAGLVFTVYKPVSNRERNIYQRFYEYHDRLYQLVNPVPINRLSLSAIERTLTGILGSCILNIIGYEVDQSYKGLYRGDDFAKAYRKGEISDDKLIELSIQSLGIDKAGIAADSYELLVSKISGIVKSQRRLILNEDKYSTTQRMRPQPVSSLREVSDQVYFSLMSDRSLTAVRKVMKGLMSKDA